MSPEEAAAADAGIARIEAELRAPAELAAALAETRTVRQGYAALCREFGPSLQSGWSARISLTVLNRHRDAAGLDRFSRTESNQREDITMRYRRERDEARAVVADMILAYKHLGHDRWASEITGSKLPVWHDRAGLDADAALNRLTGSARDD